MFVHAILLRMVFTARAIVYGVLALLCIVGIGMAFSSMGGYYEHDTQAPYERVITVGGTPFKVDVADTPAERERGLSNTPPQPPRALLFIFDYDERWGIWMKDMQYPIDVLWIDADNTVVHMVPDMHPRSFPRVYRSDTPARYVLELPAGTIEAYNLALGNQVVF